MMRNRRKGLLGIDHYADMPEKIPHYVLTGKGVTPGTTFTPEMLSEKKPKAKKKKEKRDALWERL